MRNCTRETLALAREELAKYVINNMHPVYQITDWANEPVNKWINGNKDVILKLQSAAIYQQAHHEAQQ